MIIGCPACHTKFSVDAQQLAEVENPRFHCSRCGHVFDLRDAEQTPESGDSDTNTPEDEQTPLAEDVEGAQDIETPSQSQSHHDSEEVDSSSIEQYFSDDKDAEQLSLIPERDKAEELRRVSITQSSETESDDDFEVDSVIEEVAPVDWPGSHEEQLIDVESSSSQFSGSAEDYYADTEILDAEEIGEVVVDPLSGVKVDWESNKNEADVYSVDPPEDLSAVEIPEHGAWSTGESDTFQSSVEDIDELPAGVEVSEESEEEEEYFEAAPAPDAISPVTIESKDEATAEKPFSSRGTMRTWIDPVVPSQSKKSTEKDSSQPPAQETDLKNLFGVDWQEAAIGDEVEESAEEHDSPAWDSEDAAAPVRRNTLFEGVEDTEIGSADASKSEWSSGEKPRGASMSKTFTEVISRPSLDEEDELTPKNKVIDLREAPSVERERVKRKAKKRAARHERFLDDDELDSFTEFGARSGFSFPREGLPALLLVWSVPILLTAFFCLWSYHVDSTPQFIKNVFNMSADSLPKTAPSGLALIDLNSKIVALDDGTKVLEIEGRLFNATVETFRDVRLEAKVYDEQNRALSEIRIGFHNGLVNARLAALKEEAIEALQSKQGMGDALVKPNVKAPFRIVITGLTGSEEWFSARVLSVETESA